VRLRDSRIFQFNPAQKNHAAHFAHFAQICQFLNCQVFFNIAALWVGIYRLTFPFEHNGPSGQFLLSVLALRAGNYHLTILFKHNGPSGLFFLSALF
jgi:hypothetical protein